MGNADALIAELEANYDIRTGASLHLHGSPPPTYSSPWDGEGPKPPPPPYPPPTQAKVFWAPLKREVFALLCEKSAKYQKERKALESSVIPLVGVLSSFLTHQFGVAAGTASALSSVALLLPLKMGINAWCEGIKDQDLMTDAERELLTKLAK
jgi:hypothetical protein